MLINFLERKHEVQAVALARAWRQVDVSLADDTVLVPKSVSNGRELYLFLSDLRVARHAFRGAVFDAVTRIASRIFR